ncbi:MULTISPECIES: aspartate/glutamate racemase family protein [Frankia]|uniref:Hydantoin racemase n=1 Tax=Frankia alni (strain DSM 45986 / CECT 9034 / ACN14a) TaxID=326424 RepID=Q0RU71_FRAAA|nr:MULTISPECIES: aspartate/glutamate racemase family protein [Frankia]MCM3920360.1 aspartate/glutamate racemase family protein [Frankia sp. AiPs1]CAJ58873.1 Hydantoin racemase [Frankia alni ACN14a]
MRLAVVHINAERGSEPYTEMVTEVFNRVKRPETEIVHRWARLRRASDTVFGYPYLLNAVDVIHNILDAGRSGVDGAMVACSGDPGITEARTLVDIPVVGPWEATLHLASSYAYRFGVVTVEDRAWAETCHSLIARNGLLDRCVGVERIETPSAKAFTEGFGNPDFVVEDIRRQAGKLVDRGAGAIVIGSAGLSTMAAAAGLHSIDGGIPVFETLSVGLKTLELRVELTQKGGLPPTSRTGYTQRLAEADTDRVRALFGL